MMRLKDPIRWLLLCSVAAVSGLVRHAHGTYGSAAHVLAAVGAETAATHFPDASHFALALDHALSRADAELIGCVRIRSARAALSEARASNLSARVVYHSAREDVACLRFDQRARPAHFERSAVVYVSVFPMLAPLRLDASVPHVLGFMHEQHAPRTYAFASLRAYHPMVRDYASSLALEIQVVLEATVRRASAEAMSSAWLDDVARGGPSEASLESFYWTSASAHQTSKASGRGRRFLLDERARAGWHSLSGESYYSPADQWGAWSAAWKSGLSFGPDAACGLLSARVRSRAVFLTYDVSAVRASDRAACVALLLHRVLLDEGVAQVGLSRPVRMQNLNTRRIVQGGGGSERFVSAGLDGSGVVVGQSDTGIDQNCCFFVDKEHGHCEASSIERPAVDLRQRKVVQYIDYSGSRGDYAGGHGSHTAATIVGNCVDPSDERDSGYNGIAYGARIAVFDIGKPGENVDLAIPDDLADIFSPSYFAGAKLHSNSWGGGFWYDSFALEADSYLFLHDDFLAFFAGGNEGSERTVLSPALAKNAVGVAASSLQNSMAYFSSSGPSFDGRIKPDITTPGSGIMSAAAQAEGSTKETCELRSSSGTSMATPAAAACGALLMQYFQDVSFWPRFCNASYDLCAKGTFTPKAYLLKAVLLHSGTRIVTESGHLPDAHQGFGLVDLSTALPLANSSFSLFVDYGELSDFEQLSLEVHVRSSATPLKVTVSWFDPPNDYFMAKVLLHDLDLVLVNTAGERLFGNSFSTDGKSSTGSVRDELNNNEQITVAAPVAGVWTVLVQSKLLTESASQRFGVVITCDGYVSSKTHQDFVDIEELSYCPSRSVEGVSVPNFQLEVAAMDLFHAEGWRGVSYSIHNASHAPLLEGTLAAQLFYHIDDFCLPPAADYFVNMNYGAEKEQESMLLEIAACKVFLAPLMIQDGFRITSPAAITENNIKYDAYVERSCFSACESAAHVTLPVSLSEFGCEGWSGVYYAVHDGTKGVSAGTMEWGCEMNKVICLPAVEQACYTVHLYKPFSLEEYEPVLTFSSPDSSCAYSMGVKNTIATVCVDKGLRSASVDFYDSEVEDHTNVLVTWDDVLRQKQKSSVAGSCAIAVSALRVEGNDLSCMRTCSGYPAELAEFSDGIRSVCDFLVTNVYSLCGTFGVSRGLCPRPACAESCSLEEWCYFGATSALSCSTLTWDSQGQAAEISAMCVNAAAAPRVATKAPADPTRHYALIAVCFFIVFVSCMITAVSLFPRRAQASGKGGVVHEDGDTVTVEFGPR